MDYASLAYRKEILTCHRSNVHHVLRFPFAAPIARFRTRQVTDRIRRLVALVSRRCQMVTAGAVAATTAVPTHRQAVSARRRLSFLIATVQHRGRLAGSRRPIHSQNVLKIYLVGFRLGQQGSRRIHDYHISRIAGGFVDVRFVDHYNITIFVVQDGARLIVGGLLTGFGMFQGAAVGAVLRTPSGTVAILRLAAVDVP